MPTNKALVLGSGTISTCLDWMRTGSGLISGSGLIACKANGSKSFKSFTSNGLTSALTPELVRYS